MIDEERLSTDDLAALLPDEGDEAPVTAPEPEEIEEIQDADPTADEEDEDLEEGTLSDEDEADEDDDASEHEPDDPSGIVLDMPTGWGDEEAKAEWVKLPRSIQQQVISREKDRNSATDRILSTAGEERKKAVEATKALGAFAERAEQVLEALDKQIGESEFDQLSPQQQYQLSIQNPELYSQHKAYSEYLKTQRDEARKVKENARLAHQESFAEEQANLLKQHVPEVFEAHSQITDYLGKTFGYNADQVRLSSAADRVLAFKAMKYDEMTSKAKAKATSSKQPAKPAPKGLKASPGQTSTPSQRKTVRATKAFKAKPSVENLASILPDDF